MSLLVVIIDRETNCSRMLISGLIEQITGNRTRNIAGKEEGGKGIGQFPLTQAVCLIASLKQKNSEQSLIYSL